MTPVLVKIFFQIIIVSPAILLLPDNKLKKKPLFCKALKLKSIVRGDAPSSLAASGICKKEVS